MKLRFFEVLSNKTRPPFYLIWLGWFVGALLDLIDSVIALATLTVISPSLGLYFRDYIVQVQVRAYYNNKVNQIKNET